MKQRLPLFETLAAVFAVAAVAFLTALPAASDAGQKNGALVDGLSVLRTAVFRFSMDHQAQGSPLMPGRNDQDFAAQLCERSRADGTTQSLGDFEDRYLGPYLEEIPVNPVNGKNTVRVMPEGYTTPVLNGSAGWVYVPDTGKIYADLPGTDDRGEAFLSY